MKDTIKRFQLLLHHHYNDIRHWLVIIIGSMLLIFSMVSLGNQNRLSNKVTVLAQQNKILSQQNKELNEQTKKLGEENQAIAKQNRAYTRCIAQIFAKYTQNFIPITNLNLDTCTFDSQPHAINNTPARPAETPPTSSSATPASTPSTSPTPSQASNTNTGQGGGQTQPTEPQKPLNCSIDLLGLHLGCP